jgi:hypothetical protein
MFLTIPFLDDLRIFPIIMQALQESGVRDQPGSHYLAFDILVTLLLGFLLKNKTFDDIHDTLGGQPYYGVWIGRKRLPCTKIIKQKVREIDTPILVKRLKQLFTNAIAQAGIVDLGVLYIDSHFMTYYGKGNISKGYSTIRRLALRGIYHHFVNDRKGRPVMFYLTNGSERLKRTFWILLKDVQDLRREHQPNKPLFLIFDREIYDAKLFKRLDAKQVVFITFMKNPPDCPDENFTKTKTIDVQFRTKISTYQMFDTYTDLPGYHPKVKTLVIRDPKSGCKSTIITNCDRVKFQEKQIRPRNATLVGYLLNHWGQENFFKRTVNEINIDHHFGYQIEDCSPQPTIDNPKVKELRKKLANHKKDLLKKQSQIASFIVRHDKSLSFEQLAQDKPKFQELLQEQLDLRSKITLCRDEMDSLPKQVLYTTAFPTKTKKECHLDKKDLLDTLKVMAWHVILLMEHQLRLSHGNRRTVVPTLEKLLSQPADLILLKDKTVVHIHPFRFSSIQSSAQIFCHNLNRRKIVHLVTDRPLYFKVLRATDDVK